MKQTALVLFTLLAFAPVAHAQPGGGQDVGLAKDLDAAKSLAAAFGGGGGKSDGFVGFIEGLFPKALVGAFPKTRSVGEASPKLGVTLGAKLIAVFPSTAGEFMFSKRTDELKDLEDAIAGAPGLDEAFRTRLNNALAVGKKLDYERYAIHLIGIMESGANNQPLAGDKLAPPDVFVASGLWASGQALAVTVGKKDLSERFKPHGQRLITRLVAKPKRLPPEAQTLDTLKSIMSEIATPEPREDAVKGAVKKLLAVQ
jgi:hypothetical protein